MNPSSWHQFSTFAVGVSGVLLFVAAFYPDATLSGQWSRRITGALISLPYLAFGFGAFDNVATASAVSRAWSAPFD